MLYGQTVALRPIVEEDLDVLTRWRNDPENRSLFFSPFFVALGGQKKWLERLLSDSSRLQFMVLDRADCKPVGTIGLQSIDYRNQSAELYPMLVDPDQRGRGLASDACAVLVRYAFRDLNLHRLTFRCYAFNAVPPAIEKLGFRREARFRKAAFTRGEFHDVLLFGLLRADWEAATSDDR